MISALVLLYVIDLMYQKNNPRREYKDIYSHRDGGRRINFNQENFEQKIAPACAAVYIHNLPDKCFSKAKIDRSKAPVAFLLKLSDCLQEWERPSYKDHEGLSAERFDIKIENENLVFQAQIPLDQKKS